MGVEKGDKVKEGQVLVRLEDDEFRAQYQQAHGAAENARAYYQELQHGSRPEEIQQAEHNLAEARATLANDKIVLDRTRNLTNQGVLSNKLSMMRPPSSKPISSARIRWREVFNLPKSGRAPRKLPAR